ncbi:MFS transporter [Demequina rhizosphaerae]|uniref:MFS transporter n=1 Tax=Demequina rhizosphaerae TaxID=1638985 RepID=UPI0007847347|nr:MFS transporter [Demequina rhizosphaerae]
MTTAPVADSMRRLSPRVVVGFLLLCELASGFAQGFYPPLLGEIAEHMRVSDADITWFLTVQTLGAAVCVPLLSRLGDVFGHRRILRIAVVAVIVGGLLTAFAPNYETMLIGRLLTAPEAAWLPLEIALIHNRIKGDTARSSIGLLVSFLTGGLILGTVASGTIAGAMPSLTATLLVPVVFGLVAVYAAFFKVPESTERTRVRIDGIGFAGIGIAMIALLFGLHLASDAGFGAPSTLITLAVAAAIFVAWVAWERRSEYPAIDVRMVVSPKLGPAYLAAFLFGMVLFGTQTPITTFLAADPAEVGYGFAAAPGTVSAIMGLLMIMATVGAGAFAPLARRIGMRAVLVSGAALAAGAWAFQIAMHDAMWHMYLFALVGGIGMGLLMGALPALIAEAAPSDQTGIAAGIYNSLRTLGGAAAGAVFAVLLTTFTPVGDLASSLGGYVAIWTFSAAAFVVVAIALGTMRMSADETVTDAHALGEASADEAPEADEKEMEGAAR